MTLHPVRFGRNVRRPAGARRVEEFQAALAEPARHRDALIFPDAALMLNTTTDLSIDGVISGLAGAARPPDDLRSFLALERPSSTTNSSSRL